MTPTIDDKLWAALGDPTRRRLLDLLLADGSGTATSLSSPMTVTRQAVTKHLAVLQRAALVVPRKDGREVRYVVNEVQFARAVEQMASVGAAWHARLRRIKTIAESIEALRSTKRASVRAERPEPNVPVLDKQVRPIAAAETGRNERNRGIDGR